jgi:hypothetical protein
MFSNRARTVRALACVVASLAAAIAAQGSVAQPASAGRGFGFAYDRTREIAVIGTIQGFAPLSERRGPMGLHLLVSSSGKVVDAHVGPYLSKENQQALRAGQLVQLIGVNEKVHGKNVFLVRQIVFNGRQVTVRNEHGFLARNVVSRRKARSGKAAVAGGTQ